MATGAEPRRRHRVEFIDGLRAAAALYVLIHHAWSMPYPIELDDQPTGIVGVLTGWMLYGHFGVTVFIVLAGYSLTIAVVNRGGHLNGGIITFLRRRLRRIYPPYLAAVCLTAVLSVTLISADTGTHWDLSVPLTWQGFLADVLLIQDLWPVRDVSYVFWSIAVEWHIYFTFPLLLWVWRRWNFYAATVVGGLVGVAAVMLSRDVAFLAQLRPVYYALFAAGLGACALGLLRPSWVARVPFGTAGLLVLGAVVGLCATHDYAWVSGHYNDLDLLLGVALASLLVALSVGRFAWLRAMLSSRPAIFVGAFSYSVYLVHAPLFQLAWVLGVGDISSEPAQLAVMLGLAPVVVVLAYLFHLVFERPFMSGWRRTTTPEVTHPSEVVPEVVHRR